DDADLRSGHQAGGSGRHRDTQDVRWELSAGDSGTVGDFPQQPRQPGDRDPTASQLPPPPKPRSSSALLSTPPRLGQQGLRQRQPRSARLPRLFSTSGCLPNAQRSKLADPARLTLFPRHDYPERSFLRTKRFAILAIGDKNQPIGKAVIEFRYGVHDLVAIG